MSISTVSTISDLRSRLGAFRGRQKIGVVPTMGNLHDGHLELTRSAVQNSDVVVATVFVNPLQFGENEDFDDYPRTLEGDTAKLDAAGVDILFAPSTDEIFPESSGPRATVSVPELAGILCGAARPGHFDGVTTIVTKLFNIVQPDAAFFGEKDWQQLTIISAMARQLNMPVRIVGVPTVRAEDGLALSSRNQYLTDAERRDAPILYQTLQDIAHAIASGARNFRSLEQTGRRVLRQAGQQGSRVHGSKSSRLCLTAFRRRPFDNPHRPREPSNQQKRGPRRAAL